MRINTMFGDEFDDDKPKLKKVTLRATVGDPVPAFTPPSPIAAQPRRPVVNPNDRRGALGGAEVMTIDNAELERRCRVGVCFTGKAVSRRTGRSYTRSQMVAFLRGRGYSYTDAVEGSTRILFVGNDPGATKVNAARNRGVPLVDMQQLFAILGA